LISKAQVTLSAIVLVAVTATVSVFIFSNWDPFPPKDFEDCASRAATTAKTKDALSVLLSICGSEFKGRRKAGGGYHYYDSCQERIFDIKGPNPTPDEQTYMREQCSAYLDAQARIAAEEAESARRAQRATQEERTRQLQAAQQARARELQATQEARAEENRRLQELQKRQFGALRNVKISETKIECHSGCFFDLAVTNGSKEVVNGISFGWMFPSPQEVSCPGELSTKKKENYIKLMPGETRWVSLTVYDAPPRPPGAEPFQRWVPPRYCIKVTGVEITP
jgi:hypothetical protein